MSAAANRPAIAALAICVLALLVAGEPSAARADVFGSISVLSADPFGQVEFAHDPVLSEDGRYIVFDGSIGGVRGVWRRETTPGASFEQVAGGVATLPSVSADGRYVSFTTNEGSSLPSITDAAIHDGTLVREAPSVYVRDMDKRRVRNPESGEIEFEPGAFTLVSAKDHSTQSLTYEFPGADEEELEGDTRTFGATAAGRSAITADGRTVVFVTTAQSDLAGPGTPPLQVAVRHLDSDETQLVSVRYDPATGRPALNPETGEPEPVPLAESFRGSYSAVWTNGVRTPFKSFAENSITQPYAPAQLPGAAISADGTAVAWYGAQISEQARMLGGERTPAEDAEPLWRRIAGGPSEPTRRVTGGSDPESPGCLADPQPALGPGSPCQGPFLNEGFGTFIGGGASDYVPRLSADGDYVAFLATAPLTGEGGSFGLNPEERNSDVYRQDMTASDKTGGLRRLTSFASGEPDRIATNADITDLAISPDGQQVAFTTKRTVFPLAAPAYVSAPSAVPGLDELYDADLADETLTRLTHGYEGGQPEHPELESANEDRYPRPADGALSPSFADGGQLLAFSGTASNLVFGDGNSPPNSIATEVDGADVFIVPRISFSTEPTPQTISPAPSNPSLEPPWILQVSASPLANGTVRLKARAPGGGLLTAFAASVLAAKATHSHSTRRARRIVARASSTVRGDASTVTLNLQLGVRYRALAGRKGGLTSTLSVTFTAKGHPTLRKKLTIHFVRRAAHHRHAKGRR